MRVGVALSVNKYSLLTAFNGAYGDRQLRSDSGRRTAISGVHRATSTLPRRSTHWSTGQLRPDHFPPRSTLGERAQSSSELRSKRKERCTTGVASTRTRNHRPLACDPATAVAPPPVALRPATAARQTSPTPIAEKDRGVLKSSFATRISLSLSRIFVSRICSVLRCSTSIVLSEMFSRPQILQV